MRSHRTVIAAIQTDGWLNIHSVYACVCVCVCVSVLLTAYECICTWFCWKITIK